MKYSVFVRGIYGGWFEVAEFNHKSQAEFHKKEYYVGLLGYNPIDIEIRSI